MAILKGEKKLKLLIHSDGINKTEAKVIGL